MRRLTAVLGALVACAAWAGCIPTHSNVVYDGQSYNLTPGPLSSYPAQVEAQRPTDTWSVAAVNATSWTNLAPTASARQNLSGGFDVLVMAGGFHDLVAELDSGQKVYEDAVAYAKDARRRGFDAVVILTVPPSTVIRDVGAETARLDHNRLLLESAEFDAVVDITTVPCINDPLSACYIDGVHWTRYGAGLVADRVRPVLADVIG